MRKLNLIKMCQKGYVNRYNVVATSMCTILQPCFPTITIMEVKFFSRHAVVGNEG